MVTHDEDDQGWQFVNGHGEVRAGGTTASEAGSGSGASTPGSTGGSGGNYGY